jgi:hypothetical protein
MLKVLGNTCNEKILYYTCEMVLWKTWEEISLQGLE